MACCSYVNQHKGWAEIKACGFFSSVDSVELQTLFCVRGPTTQDERTGRVWTRTGYFRVGRLQYVLMGREPGAAAVSVF